MGDSNTCYICGEAVDEEDNIKVTISNIVTRANIKIDYLCTEHQNNQEMVTAVCEAVKQVLDFHKNDYKYHQKELEEEKKKLEEENAKKEE